LRSITDTLKNGPNIRKCHQTQTSPLGRPTRSQNGVAA